MDKIIEMPPAGIRQRIVEFFKKPFWRDNRTIFWLYLLIPVIVSLTKIHKPANTYMIYKSVYWNTLQQLPLFDFYPYLNGDCNHYGPVFFYIIAPFASLPDYLGMPLWEIFLTATFYVAVRYMPLQKWQQVFMFWFCAHEVLTPLFVEQYDLAQAAVYMLTFACVEKKKNFWAAFFIVLNTFVKIYGIMGLIFFFFVSDKKKFIAYLCFWAVVMFVAPMLVASPQWVIDQYFGWYDSLVLKNADNMFDSSTNTSLLGMARKISRCSTYSDLWLIIPGILIFLTPYRRISQYKHAGFRYAVFASGAMFMLLFSTGSESYGYIVPMTGFVVWYSTAPWKRSTFDLCLLIYAFIFTSLCTSDVLFPRFIWTDLIKPYALKALPSTIVWLYLIYEMNTKDYAPREGAVAEKSNNQDLSSVKASNGI